MDVWCLLSKISNDKFEQMEIKREMINCNRRLAPLGQDKDEEEAEIERADLASKVLSTIILNQHKIKADSAGAEDGGGAGGDGEQPDGADQPLRQAPAQASTSRLRSS